MHASFISILESVLQLHIIWVHRVSVHVNRHIAAVGVCLRLEQPGSAFLMFHNFASLGRWKMKVVGWWGSNTRGQYHVWSLKTCVMYVKFTGPGSASMPIHGIVQCHHHVPTVSNAWHACIGNLCAQPGNGRRPRGSHTSIVAQPRRLPPGQCLQPSMSATFNVCHLSSQLKSYSTIAEWLGEYRRASLI